MLIYYYYYINCTKFSRRYSTPITIHPPIQVAPALLEPCDANATAELAAAPAAPASWPHVAMPPVALHSVKPKAKSMVASAESSQAKKRRKLLAHATDELVERKVYDNFQSLKPSDVDALKIGGLTLRERIKEDLYKSREDSKFKMGALYYKELKSMYVSSGSASAELIVKDQTQVVSETLVIAITAHSSSQKKNRSR